MSATKEHANGPPAPSPEAAWPDSDAESRLLLERLTLERNLLSALMDNVPDHIYFKDADSHFIRISKAHAKSFGLEDPAQALGKTDFDFFTEEHARTAFENEREIIRTGRPMVGVEEKETWPDGRETWVSTTKAPFCDSTGKIIGTFGISRDITERKQAAQQLRLADKQLMRTNQSLMERTTEIQSFYHTLSHELKTPLTSAREFISILMDGLAGPLNETQLEYLGIAKESCDQLRLYINDMLDVTRLETGKMSLEFQVAPLAPLVETVVGMLGPAAAGKSVHLSQGCQPDLPAIPFDLHRIRQVLTNLVTNAIKFTPSGGKVFLHLSEAPADPECLQVTVRDTGCGIPRNDLGLIFNRLYQAQRDATAAESRSGLGLGLYICQELVQLHGGRIWAESEPGQGSTFTFTIPKRRRAPVAYILVVDDEAAICSTLRALLEKEGYQVALAGGGAEALGLMRQQRPALVILDLDMPDMDGAETLAQIRQQWKDLPVVLHTADPESEIMIRTLKCAPFAILTKPATRGQILNTVRSLVQPNHETGGSSQSHPPPRPAAPGTGGRSTHQEIDANTNHEQDTRH